MDDSTSATRKGGTGIRDWARSQEEHFRRERAAVTRYSSYGLTAQQVWEMAKLQGNKCAICFYKFVDERSFVIDHCHKTNKVRGLLCSRCNTGLGMFLDNQEVLRRAATYLKIGEQL